MGTSQLVVYNDCLLILGERSLASLSEEREPRRVLDGAWSKTVSYCLEKGFWNFAMRAVEIDKSTTATPQFGYSGAFLKPSDWVRTYQVSIDERFDYQVDDMVDEREYWFLNADTAYFRYVSNHSSYGADPGLWPPSFADLVAVRLAFKTAKRLTGSEPSDDVKLQYRRAMAHAKSTDAMNEPPGRIPAGTWSRSRYGGVYGRNLWDRSS